MRSAWKDSNFVVTCSTNLLVLMSTGCTRGSIENSDNFLVLLLDNILFFETFPRIDVDCSSGLWLVQADHVMVILCSDWWMSWHVNWKTTGFSKAETKVLHQVHRISDELKLFLVRSFWWLVKRSWDFHFFGSTERQYWDSREDDCIWLNQQNWWWNAGWWLQTDFSDSSSSSQPLWERQSGWKWKTSDLFLFWVLERLEGGCIKNGRKTVRVGYFSSGGSLET